ncbi:MAG: hypothetical protein AB9866_19345 [Syntrophobacteraceae bacterium]
MREFKDYWNNDALDGLSRSSVVEFTDFLELQAIQMELCGHMGEAGALRKWATELRRKTIHLCHSERQNGDPCNSE